MKNALLLLLLFLNPVISLFSQKADWETYYEKSGYLETPRYDETMSYCKRLAEKSKMITCTTFGTSAQGRALRVMTLDRVALSDPSAIRAKGRIVLLVQA